MPKNIDIIKASGEKEKFDPQKVIKSLQRAGANNKEIKEVLKKLYPVIKNGMTTKEIYYLVYSTLRSLNDRASSVAGKYSLKRAIAELGPSGYPFEKFISGIFEYLGYKTETNLVIQGECVSHEIDVLATKEKEGEEIEKEIIEVKFHKRFGFKTDIQTALYVYARFLDLKNIIKPNPKIWIVTNTKVTSEVKKYALCKEINIISWNYPIGNSLREILDKTGLQPITVLTSLNTLTKDLLLENGIVFLKDIEKSKNLLPNLERYNELANEAERIMHLK